MEEYLRKIDEVIEKGYYKDNWESLTDFEVPSWCVIKDLSIFYF